MKTVGLVSRTRKALRGRSRGFTLIEVVIAMLLLGMIGVAVLTSLSYASTILIIADRRATAESLAKTQMEYVKNQEYITAENGGVGNYLRIEETDIPEGYTVWSVNRTGELLDSIVAGIPWSSGNNTDSYVDFGLQKIKLVIGYYVLRYDVTTQASIKVAQNFTLEDYKRDPDVEE
ncbi:MAG: type II secretion system GspH family protein [Dehalococcoidia bacterium]|nr:type II secretion system GspH family protein [Dehalococcoidia bacterium]MDH4366677.1 type II secretion system GspH family protein [Dehalococcoidia bacterium]